jgi:hypothetical protein
MELFGLSLFTLARRTAAKRYSDMAQIYSRTGAIEQNWNKALGMLYVDNRGIAELEASANV